MKKRIITAVLLVAVLAGLVYAYTLLRGFEPEKPETPKVETVSYPLFSLTRDEISRIYKKTDDFEFTLVKNQKWSVLGSDTIKLDDYSVNSYLYDIASVTSFELISENESYPAEYGLAAPSGIITATMQNGEKHTLNIGNKTPAQQMYYASTEREPNKIYTLYATKVDALLAPLDKIRDKTILDISQDDISFVNITRTSGDDFSIRKMTEAELEKSMAAAASIPGIPYASWQMTKPYQKNVSGEALDELLFKLSALTVSEFVMPDGKTLTDYGLDKPEYTVEYGGEDGKKVKLLLGRTENGTGTSGGTGASGSFTYAQISPNTQVFKLTGDSISFRDMKSLSLIDKLAFLVNIDDVAELKIVYRDEAYSMSAAKIEGNDYDCKINGRPISQSVYKKLYQDVIGIIIDGLADKSKTASEAEITIEYTYNDGRNSDTVQLFSAGERYYAISINGKIDWQTEKKNINVMLEKLKEL